MKNLIGTCVDNPFNSLQELETVIVQSHKLNRNTFLNDCAVNQMLKADIFNYPNDYQFGWYKDIYFYTHSCVEHFYR